MRGQLRRHTMLLRGVSLSVRRCVYTVGDADVQHDSTGAAAGRRNVWGVGSADVMPAVTRYLMIVPRPSRLLCTLFSQLLECARRKAATSNSGALMSRFPGAWVLLRAPAVQGYLLELSTYLRSAAVGPTRIAATRTCLSGLAATTLDGRLTALRCSERTSADDLFPFRCRYTHECRTTTDDLD